MSLPYNTSRALFEGNGVAVRFPFTFKVWNSGQLRLMVEDPTGALQAVQAEAVELEESGGVVTYRREGQPLPSGWKLAVLRNMSFTQGVDLLSGTRFDPQVIEDQLDQATAERQQLLEEVGRAIKVPPSSDNPPELLADMIFEARDQAEGSAVRAKSSADKATAEAASIKNLEVDVKDAPYGGGSDGEYDAATGVLTLHIPRGATGPQGPQGAEGPQGIAGAVGPQGPRGIQGIQGAEGERGPEGQQGLMGPQGIQGPRGEQGELGPVGPQGVQGETGERGPQGPEGPTGATGDKGPLGDSPLPLTFGNMRVNMAGYLEFEYNGGPLDERMFRINPATGGMEVHL